jgi:small-conductance mechanosensitive channel
LTTLENFQASPLFARVVVTVVGLIIIYLLSRAVRWWLVHSVRDDRSLYRSRKLVSFLPAIVVVLFVTVVYSEHLGGLTLALGVGSAGVAFALQEVITRIAGWIGDIYRTGDRVRVGGVTGDVIDIGVVRTTLMEVGERVRGDLYSGRVVRVANSCSRIRYRNTPVTFPFSGARLRYPSASAATSSWHGRFCIESPAML